MTEDTSTGLPSQKELEKEVSDYLSRKYGDRVRIVTTGILPGEAANKNTDKEEPLKQDDDSYKDFELKPDELVDYLNEYVVQQGEAKAVLSTKICTHFNRIRYLKERQHENRREVGRIKNNVLLIGPTGVGKTYLIKLIARKIGVPFVKGDATKFSETGYVGGDVEDLVRDLVREADGDLNKAQYGIIYIDEVDKISRSQNRLGADVSRSGVQRALLKPMEETEVEMKVPHDIISQMEAVEQFRSTGKRQKQTINTKNILFIMSGSFDGLEDIIRKRSQQQTIGFEGQVTSGKRVGQFLKMVKAEDLVSYGFESEFVGRLPIVAVLNWLTAEDYYEILINPNCPVVLAKKQDFLVYGINLAFTDKALQEVARLASQEKTGARGLVSVLEKALLLFEQKLPSSEISFLVVTEQLITNPSLELERLLSDTSARQEHKKIYGELAKIGHHRLVDFFRESRSSFLKNRGIICTEKKLDIMTSLCHQENIDTADLCDLFVDLISLIKEWQVKMSEKFDLNVIFLEDAIDKLLEFEPLTRQHIDKVCSELMGALEFGLRLMAQKKHVDRVEITAFGVEKPEDFINELVEKTFKDE